MFRIYTSIQNNFFSHNTLFEKVLTNFGIFCYEMSSNLEFFSVVIFYIPLVLSEMNFNF